MKTDVESGEIGEMCRKRGFMGENTELVGLENTSIKENSTEINKLIYIIWNRQVMIDSDLTSLYQIETKNLNKAMKRVFQKTFAFN